MTKKLLRFLLGLNGASLVRGWRLGFPEFINGCFASLEAAHPLQDRTFLRLQREFDLIPTTTLDAILADRKPLIQFQVQKYEDGMLPANEAMALLSVLVAENPGEVLEIGTYMGYTTRAMAENLPGAIIHTVDLPLDFSASENTEASIPKDDFHLIHRRVVGREFKQQPAGARIQQHFGDTALVDFQEFGHPTFFFIDGSHTYEYCKQDSEKCFALCKGNGTFLWHDCDQGHPGVVKFIREWRAAGRNICRIAGTPIAYWKSVG